MGILIYMAKEIYNRNTITKGKRLLAFFADATIFIVLSILIYSFAVIPITKLVTPLNEYSETIKEDYQKCQNLLIDSHLVSFSDDGREISLKETIVENLNYKLEDFAYNASNEYIDYFYYFYITFNNESLTFKNEKILWDIQKINEEIYNYTEHTDMFELVNGDVTRPLKFKDEVKIQLKAYLSEDINAENQLIFETYFNLVYQKITDAINYLGDSDQYIEYASAYTKNVNNLLYIYTYSSLITFTIMFVIYYLIIPLIFKKGQTIGKKILHIGVFDLSMTPIKPTFVVIRAVLQYIFYIGFILFIPSMQIGLNVISLPLFNINNSVIQLFPITFFSLILCLIDYVFMVFNLNSRSLRDKVCGVIVLKDSPEIYDLNAETKPTNVIEQENFDRGC